ncbi:hypothetical protein [Streptomyces sp. MA15]|uniref:hypothetical protein n=1 Tax=Streptomyces sp. MA15 TaxID=3055061 RepID=UPI0025AF5F18|nr:hypothetical protein [Streptomyces sp. MA15]MDN3272479.1 hypothetical protein [Streptomyces sp. MA15]
MPDISGDPVYLWLTGARPATAGPGAPTPADLPTRRPAAATASDIARREGLDLGDLSTYQRHDRRARGRGGKPTVLQAVIRFATTGLRIPRERAVAHAQRWAASPITEPDEALEWISLLGLGGLDAALRLRRNGVTPAMEKTRRESEEQARRDARAAQDRLWAEIAARYRPGIAAQLRLNGCTPDMLDRVINGKTVDQLLREGRSVQIVINALRDTHG